MSTELPRKAAAILRERGEAATPGEWRDIPMGSEGSTVLADPPAAVPSIITSRRVGRFPGFTDAEYVAMMHPGVAVALADLLDMLVVDREDAGVDGYTWDRGVIPLARLIVDGAS